MDSRLSRDFFALHAACLQLAQTIQGSRDTRARLTRVRQGTAAGYGDGVAQQDWSVRMVSQSALLVVTAS